LTLCPKTGHSSTSLSVGALGRERSGTEIGEAPVGRGFVERRYDRAVIERT